MQTASHSQQPQAALDWHLLQQSSVVRALTMGPMLPSPPMMTFSRKAEGSQHPDVATVDQSSPPLVVALSGADGVGGDRVGGGDGGCMQVSHRAISTLNCGEVKALESLVYTAGVVAPSLGLSHSPVHPVRLTFLPKVSPVEMLMV